jgi:hypothetical protein
LLDPVIILFGHFYAGVFEWYVVRCASDDGYQNDMCLREIGQCVQHMREGFIVYEPASPPSERTT